MRSSKASEATGRSLQFCQEQRGPQRVGAWGVTGSDLTAVRWQDDSACVLEGGKAQGLLGDTERCSEGNKTGHVPDLGFSSSVAG